MSDVNQQVAPFPIALFDLVENCKLNPGWTVALQEMDRGQGSKGLTLIITTQGYDSYHPDRGETYRVRHFFPVPPAAFDRQSWQRWLFDTYLDVQIHEGMEFFVIDGKRPYAPHHGDGQDPYTIFERGSTDQARERPS
jgi:hypothetical protein